ncbi:hypothetical protein RRG08_040976 [Elysia crispata]|uniref:Uncharacterized protein n=1 Tax=Elysia crispata TaxID=231223 RepID=A0AAE0YZX7_9GAST|nr:hypothetical protein RRG08_040976 [Elysia crispata]
MSIEMFRTEVPCGNLFRVHVGDEEVSGREVQGRLWEEEKGQQHHGLEGRVSGGGVHVAWISNCGGRAELCLVVRSTYATITIGRVILGLRTLRAGDRFMQQKSDVSSFTRHSDVSTLIVMQLEPRTKASRKASALPTTITALDRDLNIQRQSVNKRLTMPGILRADHL